MCPEQRSSVAQDKNGTVEEGEFVQYFSDALSSDPDEFNSTMEDFMKVCACSEHVLSIE